MTDSDVESVHSHEIEGGVDAERVTSSPEPMHDEHSVREGNGKAKHDGSEEGSVHGNGNGKVYSEDDDEEGSDESGEDDEDDEEEEEPAMKYELLGGFAAELLQKDAASAIAVTSNIIALGMHSGVVHVLDMTGKRIRSFKPHTASINGMHLDSDFIGTASVDGLVSITSITTSESYNFDMKRPMRTVCLEPQFSKRGSRAFVCGGLSGKLSMYEKGWLTQLGHRETVLHTGEGPIWNAKWRSNFIAWANDTGVKIYDTSSQLRITYIDRHPDSPRADLFKCNLHWQDDSTLLIAWADYIKVARIRARPRSSAAPGGSLHSPFIVEIASIFQVDCMISGIVPHPSDPLTGAMAIKAEQTSLNSFLILAYTPPESILADEATDDRAKQARNAAQEPELRIISRSGEELSSDVLKLAGYQTCGCNDYSLAEVLSDVDAGRCYVILNPKSVVIARPRDAKDHVEWLVDRHRFEEALEVIESAVGHGLNAAEIGQQYIEHLIQEGDYTKAAQLCPTVLGQDAKRWEDWVFVFAQHKHLQAIIPHVPTESPTLNRVVYEMILGYYIVNDRFALRSTIGLWPTSIYDMAAIIVAVQAEHDRLSSDDPERQLLQECLADLYMNNRQPGKALTFFLQLRRPNVFDLIRDNNLFTDVKDQALLLVEFDQELAQKRKETGVAETRSTAITLLVDHTYSIPVSRVVQQLESRPYFLFLYLDALFAKDPLLVSDYADKQVELTAEYKPSRLMDLLRASTYYSLEKAHQACKVHGFVAERVFLLGRMGNNKEALALIIEQMGDVNRAIDFAKEQNDDDLWEDLLKYSETRPTFIRGLLENVGPEIDPLRLIRRIKNGLEITGLKDALIKILHDYNIQISLLEGCQNVMNGDRRAFSGKLLGDQSRGFYLTVAAKCPVCSLPLYQGSSSLTVFFLCHHVVHLKCVSGIESLPQIQSRSLTGVGSSDQTISDRVTIESMLRNRMTQGCPVCQIRDEGIRIPTHLTH